MRRTRPLLAALLVLTSPVALSAAPAVAAPSGDTVSVTGWDFRTERPALVTAGDTDNRLVFRYVAGQPLEDGTVVVDLPRAAWPTPLVAGPGDESLREGDVGAVAARPVPFQDPDPAVDCVGVEGIDLQASVVTTRAVSRIVVPHVDCAAGAALLVRVNGVQALRAGRYAFPVRAFDASGTRLTTRAPLTVVPTPRTRLVLLVPAGPYVVNEPVSVSVLALRPNGRIDPGYRGQIGLTLNVDGYCGFSPTPATSDTFTAADQGVLDYTFFFGNTVTGLTTTVRAIDRSARSTTTPAYDVVQSDPPSEPITCNPVAFH